MSLFRVYIKEVPNEPIYVKAPNEKIALEDLRLTMDLYNLYGTIDYIEQTERNPLKTNKE